MQGVNCSLIPIDESGPASHFTVNVLMGNENIDVLVLKAGDAWRVYRNACPHQGRRLDYAPGKVLCKDGKLICPAHGAVFEIAGGRCLQGPCLGESLQALACETVPEGIRVYWPR